MSDITFQEETYEVMRTTEFFSMAKKHYKEVGGFKDSKKIKLSINWELYRILDRQGNLAMFTARDSENILVGYNFFIIGHHPHYSGNIIAEADSVYLTPGYRKGFNGYNFIKYAINKLKNRVDAVTLNMHIEHKFDIIAKRLGFKPLEIKYTKEI